MAAMAATSSSAAHRHRPVESSNDHGPVPVPWDAGAIPDPLEQQRASQLRMIDAFVKSTSSYLLSPVFADMSLVVGSTEIPCHRLVLASSSERLRDMIRDCTRVELRGRRPETVNSLLRVLYFAATPRDLLLADFRSAAELYGLAYEWGLSNVMADIRMSVENDAIDEGDLQYLLGLLTYAEASVDLTKACERRFARINEAKAAAAAQALANPVLPLINSVGASSAKDPHPAPAQAQQQQHQQDRKSQRKPSVDATALQQQQDRKSQRKPSVDATALQQRKPSAADAAAAALEAAEQTELMLQHRESTSRSAWPVLPHPGRLPDSWSTPLKCPKGRWS
eukprot:TRINITY_DN5070_c0_g1_i1.p1 TRINITY_DN5070_c0_g1~~TRINITY_DN5070_c0_g1_i1.p1  ORF type:complete len:338 (+),score=87.08 TRINITY_DN5070_c0_g1_i1:79-1092(+)